jgi:two-component system phosphate regulon response regulator PhoB
MSGLDGPLVGRKVLVVDDEPSILQILSFKLRLVGMVCFEASDAEEALRIAREESPDVVLLDVSLSPGPSGFDVCRTLKENPKTRDVPVIMLTARSLPSERDAGLAAGAFSYVTKPFNTKVLIREIEQALEQ